jgi:hypothetical protein
MNNIRTIDMKKARPLNLVFAILAALSVLTFSTCKKDTAAGSTSIIGKWANNAFANTVCVNAAVIQHYEFKSNDSVEFYDYKIDTLTKKILGYGFRSTGKFKIQNSVLTMYNLINFSNSTGDFVPLAQLVQEGSSGTETCTFALNGPKNQLSLYFTCPPNADCAPSPAVYYRVE